MRREELAEAIGSQLGTDDLVVCGLGSTSRAWRDAGGPQLTYFGSDPMGLSPALALGLALSRPDRQVALLEGDGDLLMNLGVLVTIAGAEPVNLRMVVFNNGRYETGGGQPLAAVDRLALADLGRAAGWRWAMQAPPSAPAEGVRELIGELVGQPGPAMLVVPVEPEAAPYGGPGSRSGAEDRYEFQRLLAISDRSRAPERE